MMSDKLIELTRKKANLMAQLEEPARAAANQMKDAGMHKGADPLLEVLFQIDALKAELLGLFDTNPKEAIKAIIELMNKGK